LALLPISTANKLPTSCAVLQATRAGACKVAPAEHEVILAEAVRRDRLEYDSESASESEEEPEEESDELEASSDED
jgi:hypothetical protein